MAAEHEPTTCPQCASPRPIGAPSGLCAKCLWMTTMAPDMTGPDLDEEPTAVVARRIPWARLGDYDLYEEIAHGGMGVVYRAEQRRLRRVVAVKVLRGGELATPEARRRFRLEAEAAACLQHPSVVSIHDVGEEQGVCWFSMDYVAGQDLASRVAKKPLTSQEAARCVKDVALAIQHAHEHGILHRDLKPSNILLDQNEQPRVTDFGLARHMAAEALNHPKSTELTKSGLTVGSPGYVAPEQALQGVSDRRADVYGLGAVLYHVLTGRAPYIGPTIDSVLLQLRDADPVSPRRLNPTVPRDLETLCLHCLEKDPAARYQSAAEMAEDLDRFLTHRPLTIKAPSWRAHLIRWAERRPSLAALVCLLTLSVLLGLAGIFSQWRRAEISAADEKAQRLQAGLSERAARLRSYAANMYVASQALMNEDAALARSLIETAAPSAGDEDFRGPEWHWLEHETRSQDLGTFHGHPWIVAHVAWSPDGRFLASGGRFVAGHSAKQETAFVWDPEQRREVHRFQQDLGSVKSIAFTSDGQRLMIAASARIRFYETKSWQKVGPEIPGTYAAFAHHRPWLAAVNPADNHVRIYHQSTGQLLLTLPEPGSLCAFSPDDRSVFIAGLRQDIVEWTLSADSDTVPPTIGLRSRKYVTDRFINGMALSPDGRFLAVASGAHPLLWDLASLPPEAPVPAPRLIAGHSLDTKGLCFSGDSRQLITLGSDRTVRYWDAVSGAPLGVFRGHRDEVWCAQLDPVGRWLATGGKDTTVRLWPAQPGEIQPWPSGRPVKCPIWAFDSQQLLLPQRGDTSLVCQPPDLQTQPIPMLGEAATPDGHWCRFIEKPARIETFDSQGRVLKTTLLEGDPVRLADIESKAWSQDSSRFALVIPDRLVGLWDTNTGRMLGRYPRPAGGQYLPLALNRDGTIIAVAGSSAAEVRLIFTQQPVRPPEDATQKSPTAAPLASTPCHSLDLSGHSAIVTSLAFSPDSRWLASGSVDATARLWDVATGAQRHVLRGHLQDVNSVAFSPDGRSLATLGNYEAVRLWNLETASPVLVHPMPYCSQWLVFSPDGRWLAINQGDPAERANPPFEKVRLFSTGLDPQ